MSRYKSINLVIKIIISAILLYFLLTLKVNFLQIINILKAAKLSFILYSFILTACLVMIKALRWQLLIKFSLNEKISYKECILSYLYGLAPGLITPGRAGEILRITVLKGFSKEKLAELFLVDKYIEVTALFIVSAIGSLIIKLPELSFYLLLIVFVLIMMYYLRTRWSGILSWLVKAVVKREIKLIFVEMKGSHYIMYLVISLMGLFCDVFAFHFIINAIGEVGFGVCLLVFPVMLVAAVLPISISGIGVRETSAVYLFSMFNIKPEISFNAAILIFIIGSVMPAIVGWIIANYKFNH